MNCLAFVGLAGVALSFTACGGPSYTPVASVQSIKSPGTYKVPPKLDIVFFESDKGRSYQAYPAFSQQMPVFLANLDIQGYDYRFWTFKGSTFRTAAQVVASVYDPARGSSWQPPFPGAVLADVTGVSATAFRLPTNYSEFLTMLDITNSTGYDTGFQNILQELNQGFGTTGGLRSDAKLILIDQDLAEDTSSVNYCSRQPDGKRVPCEQIPNPACVPTASDPTGGSSTCSSSATSLSYFQTQLQKINPNINYYAAISNLDTESSGKYCLGASASISYRRQATAGTLGGKWYDICSVPVSQILADINQQITIQTLNYTTRYLIAAQAPNVSTIQITEYMGGDTAKAVVIPQDATNGWSYVEAGQPLQNVYSIYATTPTGQSVGMNSVSGYAIQLNGTAQMTGGTTASLQYTPAGLTSASSNK